MSGSRKSTRTRRRPSPPPPPPPPPPPDLDRYCEATRRDLYDRTVAVHFPPPSQPHHPDDFVPDYSPEEACLTVCWWYGRYFAIWMPLEDLQEPSLPPWRRWVVLRIDSDPGALYGVAFHEV